MSATPMRYRKTKEGFAAGAFFAKLCHSWRHFGTAMMLSKAWEKYVVDKYRFRGTCIRTIPCFPPAKSFDEAVAPAAAPKTLTICYLLHYFYPDKQGGTERFVLNLAKRQQQLGHQVRVITLGKRVPSDYSHKEGEILWEEFSFEGVPITQIRYMRAPRGLYYDCIDSEEPLMASFAERSLARYAPDIVHFAYPQPFAAFAMVCHKRAVPYLITLTDFNICCHYATMVRKDGMFCSGSGRGERCQTNCRTYGVKNPQMRFASAERMLADAACITVPSRFVLNVMAQEFSALRFRVIPHGIADSFAAGQTRTATRKIIYAGTLAPLKGVALLLSAFQRLRRDVTLELYGGGMDGYVHTLRKIAKNDSRIIFRGEIPASKMPDVYRKADCIVVPSIWFETYNFVLREALACGCLAVASNMGAMPEAVAVGANGFLFDAGDESSLLAALENACDFDWSRYQLRAFPTVEDEALSYEMLYQNCLKQKKRSEADGV